MGGPERVLWLGVGEGLQCKGHAVRMRRDRRRHKKRGQALRIGFF